MRDKFTHKLSKSNNGTENSVHGIATMESITAAWYLQFFIIFILIVVLWYDEEYISVQSTFSFTCLGLTLILPLPLQLISCFSSLISLL